MSKSNAEITSTLQARFGFSTFRPGQVEAIDHLLAGTHTLVVMPTGAGKSLVYQLASFHVPGITLVVSPLIALMKDQVDSLVKREIAATYINSLMSTAEQNRRLRAVAEGAVRLVYIAPERLRNTAFQRVFRHVDIGLLAIDEAHCISHWGHDFRPDYRRIATARHEFGNPLTVALTATATTLVQDDIAQLLGIPGARRIVTGFNRPNLTFEVRYTSDAKAKYQALRDLLTTQDAGAAIVYVGTRREAEEIAEFVTCALALNAQHYHAGLPPDQRASIQDAFLSGGLQIVIATNAFGMGIDRSDVRLVVHFSLPGTLEAYYQEAGRAGRDGRPSRAVLLYAPQDRTLQEWFIENSNPTPGELHDLYRSIFTPEQPRVWTALDELAHITGQKEPRLRTGLAHLERVGIIERIGDESGRMLLQLNPWDAGAVGKIGDVIEQHRQHRLQQLEQMVAYAQTNACRRQVMLNYFSDPDAERVPRCCDNCMVDPSAAAPTTPRDVATLSRAERAALIILDALHRLKWPVGRKRLAEILKGSQAQSMGNAEYQQSVYYGRLRIYSLKQIEGLIEQVMSQGHLKIVGGDRPVLTLTPQGYAALQARAAIPIQLPDAGEGAKESPRRNQAGTSDTVEITAQMFDEGLAPAQIAAERNLAESTIYSHLARLIAAGRVPLDGVVDDEIIGRVRAAIAQVGSTAALSPIKACLPETITYNEIRCVVAAEEPNTGDSEEAKGGGEEAKQQDGTTLEHRVVQLGNEGSPASVPELIAALEDTHGNVRRMAASTLGKIGDRRAVEPLIALLAQERKNPVRQAAINALGRIGDPRARSVIEHIAQDDQEQYFVRESAEIVLRLLQDAG